MKKLIFGTLLLLVSLTTIADNRHNSKEIKAEELPKTSQKTIIKYFDSLSSVSSVWQWPNNYGVYLNTGQKLNFFIDGNLKQAKGEKNVLPKEMLKELPKKAQTYINDSYGDWELVEIEFKRSKIEVDLEKGKFSVEIEFSKTGEFLGEDVDD